MKKNSAAIIAGLIVFSGLLLSTCEKRKTDVYAVVNGVDIRGKDFLTDENRKDQQKMKDALDAFIEKKVIETESKKLNTTEAGLLIFFDLLKTRDIAKDEVDQIFKNEFKDQNLGPQSKEQMLEAVREKQYDVARKKYIFELKSRSTILLIDDEGKFHPYKILPN